MISAALSLDRLPIGPGTEILPCRNRRKLCHQRSAGARGGTNQIGAEITGSFKPLIRAVGVAMEIRHLTRQPAPFQYFS